MPRLEQNMIAEEEGNGSHSKVSTRLGHQRDSKD
jgi:hypothetical protein